MPDNLPLKIYYTNRAVSDLIDIKGYILKHFTEREVNRLFSMVESFEKVVATFPELYPTSIKNKNIHRAVLSKQLSVFYRVSEDRILILAIIDNRMNTEKWPI